MSAPAARTGLALFAIYAALTCGFDASEGRDDAHLARHLITTGSLATKTPYNLNWVQGVDGMYYSAHEAGNAAALVPAVFVIDRLSAALAPRLGLADPTLIAGAMLPLVSAAYIALTVAAFCLCSIRLLGLPSTMSVQLALALGLTTILAPYSRMLFDGVFGGMLVAWALACAAIATRDDSRIAALAAGVLTGAAIATRQPLALLALPAVAHLAFDLRPAHRRWLLATYAIGVVPFIVWQGWYNAIRTGAPYFPAVAMPQFQRVNGAGDMLEGLAGFLISPGKSLLLYSPLLVLAPFGWQRLRREFPGLAWGLLIGVAAYLLVHAQVRNWSGEWGWGPRYTVPLTMPLMLPAALAIWPALAGRPSRRRSVVALAAAGAAGQLVALATNWHYYSSWLFDHGKYSRATLEWSIVDGQFGAAVTVLARNVARLAGADVAPMVVGGASATSVATGNGINLWPFTAVAAGLPPWLVAAAALSSALVAVAAVRWALRCPPAVSPSWQA